MFPLMMLVAALVMAGTDNLLAAFACALFGFIVDYCE